MSKTKTIDGIIAEAQQVKLVFAANHGFTVGEITEASLQADMDDLVAKRDRVSQLRSELTAAVNEANAAKKALGQKTARGRTGIGASFGLNSTQYEQAGGIRLADRAHPVRTVKTKGQLAEASRQ